MRNKVLILFWIVLASGAEDKKPKPAKVEPSQQPITEFLSGTNSTNIEEKEAVHAVNATQSPSTPVTLSALILPTIPPSNVTFETTTTTKTATKAKSTTKSGANVDMIIQAPVAKTGEALIDGIYVAPDKDSLSIAIGGAEIAFDISPTNRSTNASESINGEKVPEALKGTIPAFLLHATDAARRSFFEIENNGNIPKIQYLQAVTNWAQQQKPEVLTAFNKYLSDLKATKVAAQQQVTEKAKSLSQAAQRANTQIQQIQNDDSLTKTQEQTKINEIFDNLTKKVQKELADLTASTA